MPSSTDRARREMPMPAASFLTPESQPENFDGLVGVSQVAAAAADEARRAAHRQRRGSFTVRTPWLRRKDTHTGSHVIQQCGTAVTPASGQNRDSGTTNSGSGQ